MTRCLWLLLATLALAWPAARLGAAAGGAAVFSAAKADWDWKPSTNLPPGAEYHLIHEDPAAHGIQVIVRFPADYAVPPHTHDVDETLVVLKGKLRVKSGGVEKVLTAGDYAFFPAGVEHAIGVKGWGAATFLAATSGPYSYKKTP